jgi:hypothetical protein
MATCFNEFSEFTIFARIPATKLNKSRKKETACPVCDEETSCSRRSTQIQAVMSSSYCHLFALSRIYYNKGQCLCGGDFASFSGKSISTTPVAVSVATFVLFRNNSSGLEDNKGTHGVKGFLEYSNSFLERFSNRVSLKRIKKQLFENAKYVYFELKNVTTG